MNQRRRGGSSCCGTTSAWHRPWCQAGPRRYRHEHQWKRQPVVDPTLSYICTECGASEKIVWVEAHWGKSIADLDRLLIETRGGTFVGEWETMLTDAEIAFLRARLDEDEDAAWAVHDVSKCDALLYEENMAGTAGRTPDCDCGYPARALREVKVWRRALLEYRTAPLDAVYQGTERETGFRLALSAALKAKIATYDGNPVTGEPFPRVRGDS